MYQNIPFLDHFFALLDFGNRDEERRTKSEGRRTKGEGQRAKSEERRTKDEGQAASHDGVSGNQGTRRQSTGHLTVDIRESGYQEIILISVNLCKSVSKNKTCRFLKKKTKK